jgi:hypothetical protein
VSGPKQDDYATLADYDRDLRLHSEYIQTKIRSRKMIITYRFTLNIGGAERPLLIRAATHRITPANEIEFYDEADRLIATVPAPSVITFTES